MNCVPVKPEIDFKGIAAALLAQAESLVMEWLPDGKREGAEWVALNPTRTDHTPGSFKINLTTGQWSDFADGASGGDLISLYAYLNRLKQGQAARELGAQLGMDGGDSGVKHPINAPLTPKKVWTPLKAVPGNAPPPPAAHPKHGKPTAVWTYQDASGERLFYVYRFDPPGARKEIIPLSWCMSPDGETAAWRWKAMDAPRPLYNLPRLLEPLDAPVMVCEGEKAAEAAGALLPDWVVVTSCSGANAPQQTDWNPLAGRRVAIWPDHDEPGRRYAAAVTKLAQAAGAANVRTLNPAALGAELPQGWDAANAQAEGWTAERLKPMWGDTENKEPRQRPERLQIRPGERAEMTDDAELALLKHQTNLYQRGGQLVRVRMAHAETVMGVTRKGGTPIITPVDADYLVDQMDRVITWERYSERRQDYLITDAPRQIATSLLSRAGEWKANRLVSFITAPTLRPDGSLIEKLGYDAETGLLFVETDVRFPEIPASPSLAEGRAALDFLVKSVLAEFPFTAAHHRSVALSAILTALVRQSVPSAPLHAFTAPRAGSGKSLLADSVALIATGAPATVMNFAGDPDELRKRIFSVLLAGDSVVNIDNIEEPLQGTSLCSVLTSEQYTDRVLGSSRTETTNTICTWLATGNNLVFKGDITRRVLLCELDPCCERPEDRSFSRDLYDWIPKNRPRLVTAGLTAIRSYVAAGKPKQPISTLGSFGAWSDLVRSALVWLGESDPLLSRDEIESVDPLRIKLRALILAWYHTFKTMPALCNEAVWRASQTYRDETGKEVYEFPELAEVLKEYFTNRQGEICTKSLGCFLRETAKRVECGARMAAAGSSQRAMRWRVVPINQSELDKAIQEFRQG